MSKTTNPKSVSADELKQSVPEDNSQEKIEALENEIKKLTESNTDLTDKNTRLVAELHNLGNRLRREFETKKEYAISSFAKEILDVGDVLAAGLENCEDKESEHFKGMQMTLDKFYIILKSHSINPVESKDKPFDHQVHEALTSQETDEVEPGMILHVIQEGYTFKERVLRPAKVIVSKKVSENS